uniref:HEAT repeat domain-containing protein n=1 Tax=Plectus sambesii TaxID=2011161 RepID=A0A914W2B4_9BILA
MATESVADLKRQLEFGNASVQSRAFTAIIGLIANSKSESSRTERTLAIEQLWNCLKCERVQLAGWASTAIAALVGQSVLPREDAVRQCIHVLGSAHHPRIAIETIGKLLADADRTP